MLDISRNGNWDSYGQSAAIEAINDIRTSIASQRIHVAIVTVSDHSSTIFDLSASQSTNANEILAVIGGIRRDSRSDEINYYLGFQQVLSIIEGSSRANVNKLVMLITAASVNQAGRSQAITSASELHSAGYFVYGIYADSRGNVRDRDEEFMIAVTNVQSNDIKTEGEFIDDSFDYGSGYICTQVSCDASKSVCCSQTHICTTLAWYNLHIVLYRIHIVHSNLANVYTCMKCC